MVFFGTLLPSLRSAAEGDWEGTEAAVKKPVDFCSRDFTAPTGRTGFFDSQRLSYFQLVNRGPVKRGGEGLTSYALMEIPLGSDQPPVPEREIMRVAMPKINVMVPMGEKVTGVTMVIFNSRASECADGFATLVYIDLDSDNTKASSLQVFKKIQIIGGTERSRLARYQGKDNIPIGNSQFIYLPDSGSLFRVDASNGLPPQIRTTPLAYSGTNSERILFVNFSFKERFTWGMANDRRQLTRYSARTKPTGRIVFSSQDRLLSDGELFGALRPKDSDHLVITEFAGWSNRPVWAQFTLPLPKELSTENIAAKISFQKQLIALYGFTDAARREWRTAWLMNYAEQGIVTKVPTPSGVYVTEVNFIDDPNYLVAVLVEEATGKTIGLYLWDTDNKRSRMVRF